MWGQEGGWVRSPGCGVRGAARTPYSVLRTHPVLSPLPFCPLQRSLCPSIQGDENCARKSGARRCIVRLAPLSRTRMPPITATDWIWHDGEFIPWADAQVHVLCHSLQFGSSAFEGIRCYATPRGPAIFRLEEIGRASC